MDNKPDIIEANVTLCRKVKLLPGWECIAKTEQEVRHAVAQCIWSEIGGDIPIEDIGEIRIEIKRLQSAFWFTISLVGTSGELLMVPVTINSSVVFNQA